MTNPLKTIIIDNFRGNMVPQITGDMNSGDSYWLDVFGYCPFTKPNNLTWNEQRTQIDIAGSVITDLVMAGKVRAESGIVYMYAIGHTGRVYKIQVNAPTSYNPSYDNPTLLTTLTVNSPTFTRGAFIDFYGSTERMYISHDKGVTQLDFSGANETFVGSVGSWTQTVPKPLQQFVGKLYAGNGNNIAEIDTTLTVTTYTKLAPSFPTKTQVRDIKVTPDGNYLQIVSSQNSLGDLTSTSPDASVLLPADSYIFRWNGSDPGYTSSTAFSGTILSANAAFGDEQYTFGYDAFTNAIYNPTRKLITSLGDVVGAPTLPTTIFSVGNLIVWNGTLVDQTSNSSLIQAYGNIGDKDYKNGFWCLDFQGATAPETDVIQTPMMVLVSNLAQGGVINGYTKGYYGVPTVYYSTLEISSAPTTKYRFYKWPLFPTGLGTPINGALYQTQNQLFPKKVAIKQVRIYGQPWVANNGFTVDLIGSNDAPMINGSATFTAGSNLTIGNDVALFNPSCAPTYSLALRITNNGTANFIINKVEIDYSAAGN